MPSRHTAIVRVTHWLTVIAFVVLLVSGLGIVISHPRFYWGETGNVMMHPLFTIPIPASRGTVPTGYGYQWPDENGWGRSAHFQAAWLLLLAGVVYIAHSLRTGHFRRELMPARGERSWRDFARVVRKTLRRERPDAAEERAYNPVQRVAYLVVIFGLIPLTIWTGLVMSPAFTAAFPFSVVALGGRQTARTLHFFLTWALVLFVVVHVAMISLAGFRRRMRAMTIGSTESTESEGPEAGPAVSGAASAAAREGA
ncbi:MAG: cytochrome b/b6 domain-containing protein [Acidobacteriaceae bacterium]